MVKKKRKLKVEGIMTRESERFSRIISTAIKEIVEEKMEKKRRWWKW